jgi:murein DD-endopeptidase MepM/ murein hydrolase activator NlpD
MSSIAAILNCFCLSLNRNNLGSITRILLCLFAFHWELLSSPIPLANLDYSNPRLKELREDVKENLKASRSKGIDPNLRDLRFYIYTVGKKDRFFTIMAKTGMNLDTLSSVNHLASPHDIYPGQKILIPNMRGIYSQKLDQNNSESDRSRIAREESVHPDKLIYDKNTSKWFIPGGELKGKEKMFFYGFAFSRPLLEGKISSQFGKRNDPFTNKQTFHGGLDIAAPAGTAVYASADGVIEFKGSRGGYGNLIIIKHELGYETRYGHLQKFASKLSSGNLESGSRVRKGEKIGEVGMTGRATGNHLHFEVRRFSKTERPIIR